MLTLMNRRGDTLLTVLLGVAIMGITTAVFTTLLTGFQHETRSLSQKMEILNSQSEVLGLMSNQNICACNFNPSINTAESAALTFNSQNITSLNLQKIYASCLNGTPSSAVLEVGKSTSGGPTVSKIELNNFTPTGAPGSYTAALNIEFDWSKLVIARKPAKIDMNLLVDTTVPASARIIACVASAAGQVPTPGGASPSQVPIAVGTCPTGQYVVGVQSTGQLICQAPAATTSGSSSCPEGQCFASARGFCCCYGGGWRCEDSSG